MRTCAVRAVLFKTSVMRDDEMSVTVRGGGATRKGSGLIPMMGRTARMARRARWHLPRFDLNHCLRILAALAVACPFWISSMASADDESSDAVVKGLQRSGTEAALCRSSSLSNMNITYGETIVKTSSPVLTGSRLVLEVDKSMVEGTQFQWLQVEGPKAVIDDPNKASVTLTVPPGAEQLTFVLIAARTNQVRVLKVVVPVRGGKISTVTGEAAGPRVYPGAPLAKTVKADAGDDQVGLVGHRVTLNGARSIPADGDTARWMQVSGPGVTAPKQQGVFFSFIPSGSGVYRFALVVSGDREISEPDEVMVLVGTAPGGVGQSGSPAPMSPIASSSLSLNPANAGAVAPSMPPAESLVTANVHRIPGGARVAAEVADVMESVAQRSSLYSSFASLQNEMSRRLDVVIPNDSFTREAWTRTVLIPLSAYTGTELAAVGLDVRPSQGNAPAMTPVQRECVRGHFSKLARAFRAVSSSSSSSSTTH